MTELREAEFGARNAGLIVCEDIVSRFFCCRSWTVDRLFFVHTLRLRPRPRTPVNVCSDGSSHPSPPEIS